MNRRLDPVGLVISRTDLSVRFNNDIVRVIECVILIVCRIGANAFQPFDRKRLCIKQLCVVRQVINVYSTLTVLKRAVKLNAIIMCIIQLLLRCIPSCLVGIGIFIDIMKQTPLSVRAVIAETGIKAVYPVTARF